MTVLLISRSRVYENRLRRALRSSEVHTVREAFTGLTNYPNLRNLAVEDIDAIFVGPFLAMENPRRRVARLRERFPLLPIVVAHEAGESIAPALQEAGANEVVQPAATLASIAAVLDAAREDVRTGVADSSSLFAYAHADRSGHPVSDVRPADATAGAEGWASDEESVWDSMDRPLNAIEGSGDWELSSQAQDFPHTPDESDESDGESDHRADTPFLIYALDPEGADDPAVESDADDADGSSHQWGSSPATVPVIAAAGRRQVVSVVSPKGGQGKTTVAANLAVGLARLAPGSVVLIDADLQFGDVANVLSVSPMHSITDMVDGLGSRDSVVLKTLLTPHPSGLFTVCGSASPAAGERVTAEQLGALIDDLAGLFAYVVIDTSPGLGEHTLTALDKSTDAVFVSSLTVPALRALRTELDVLSTVGALPSSRHIVLNMVDRNGGLRRRDAEAIVGTGLDVVIPRSDAVTFATNKGVPLLDGGSRDPSAKAFLSLLNRVFGAGDRALLRRDRRRAAA